MAALGGLLGGGAGTASAAASAPAPAPMSFAATGAAVQTRTLANGLQVIVWPDHHIPSVALFNWVRVGSRNEGSGTTGLAHFFEHMMFNGTTHRAQGEFDRLIESNGGSSNAFTSQDVTVYQDWFPRSALELVLELESDRLANLAFSPQVVEKEREVVYSERRLRVEDSNPAFLNEQVQAVAFIAHPYRIPTIGWPSDIKAWTLADLQDFYHTWYAPNNCTLVLVGDIDPGQAFALVEKHYGPIARGPATAPVRTVEPEQTGERRLVIERSGQNPLVQVAWHAIAADDPRAPALNLLQTILTDGDAARLHRTLVEERRLAVEVGSGWSEGFDPNIYSIYATLAEGASSDAFEQALNGELARLLDQGVTEAELSRAKNQVAASFWRGVSTIDGKARLLGEYAVLHGDYRKLFAAPDAYERVTAADVLAVARAVFKPEHRTVGVLLPHPAAGH
ncbi:MAG: insulinase family protein [Gammaproteobacteria bacterium]|nr:insulinase family protein [Gammaproteobacteria bacterium]MDE2249776.1 insulinase family protein [Gammaproteobacteria bacterium]